MRAGDKTNTTRHFVPRNDDVGAFTSERNIPKLLIINY